MSELVYVLASLFFALIDPFTLVPAVAIGWFVRKRSVALFATVMTQVLIAAVFLSIRSELGYEKMSVTALIVRIVVSFALTYIVYNWKQRRNKRYQM